MTALRRTARIVGKAAITSFALIGLVATVAALTLWLAARPVLHAASKDAEATPQLCAGGQHMPKGYPKALREIEPLATSEYVVFRDACSRHGIAGCHHMTGAPRSLGFALYRQAYLSDCDVRALLLRQDALLGRALNRLYPGRNPETLTPAELDCLAAILRHGFTKTAESLGRCTLPKPQAAQAARQPAT
ncbi:hypothetical protein [Sphingomonas sp.]|uniref:hypothetical protein n=1 Tax=Sphingomonas sp. TaxID=28214 RepID=UPI003F71FF0F